MYARLTGGHKAAVTKLLALGSKEENGPDLLLSAAADGSIAVWEPSAAAPQGPDKERLPKVSPAHPARLEMAVLLADSIRDVQGASWSPCGSDADSLLPWAMQSATHATACAATIHW